MNKVLLAVSAVLGIAAMSTAAYYGYLGTAGIIRLAIFRIQHPPPSGDLLFVDGSGLYYVHAAFIGFAGCILVVLGLQLNKICRFYWILALVMGAAYGISWIALVSFSYRSLVHNPMGSTPNVLHLALALMPAFVCIFSGLWARLKTTQRTWND